MAACADDPTENAQRLKDLSHVAKKRASVGEHENALSLCDIIIAARYFGRCAALFVSSGPVMGRCGEWTSVAGRQCLWHSVAAQ